MGAIKVGAHPLVVAVAMGLLGPSALTEGLGETRECEERRHLEEVPEAPSAEEFSRVEHLWSSVRSKV